jgi:hypothetical protein
LGLIGNYATANEADNVAERNIFRFKAVKAKSGQRGVLLFAVSTRRYGTDITPYLTQLKTDKPRLLNEVVKLELPTIRIGQ